MAKIRTKTSIGVPISTSSGQRASINSSGSPPVDIGTTSPENIPISTSTDSRVDIGNAAGLPKYIGARAVVDRVEDGVRITLTDYMGTTQEIIAEAIESIVTNEDGSLTFTLPDGRTFTTDSLIGPMGPQGPPGEADIESITNSEIEAAIQL